MRTADFDYSLPQELIAQHPADRRDGSRMMVLHRATRQWEHRLFTDLPAYLRRGDLLVRNDTKVIPARIFGKKPGTGGKVELLLLEEVEHGVWDCLLRARRRPKVGDRIILADGHAEATMLADGELGRARIRLAADRPLLELLDQYGEPPLPPYVDRHDGRGSPEDKTRYQTVFAREPGAVAAPTAGLHFTPEIFQRVQALGVDVADVTLHVGLGTFRPVSAENVADHTMEAERYVVPEATVRKVTDAKTRNGRIVAIGSTSVRTLETVADQLGPLECGGVTPLSQGQLDGPVCATSGSVKPLPGKRRQAAALQGRSSLFIHPPYSFKIVDAILTNFHLPKSTLLMMMSAFAGRDFVLAAYAEAVKEKYRFFSYGDCMLIL
jgi:S-adenosylmethionine:tRNA ribosyltransferase-isomerase